MNVDFGALLSSGFIPGWAAFAVVVVAYLRHRAANKTVDAAIVDGQWARLQGEIGRLEKRVAALEREVETCHRERDEARADALKWKAAADGLGLVRDAQAISDAEKRLAGRKGEGE